MELLKQKIVDEAKRIEVDCNYSARGHFSASSGWAKVHLALGIPAVIMAAIAGTSALSTFDNSNIIAGVLSLLVMAITAVSTFLNPNKSADMHLNAGNRYNALNNDTRIFREITCESEVAQDELIRMLEELSKQRDELNQNSPLIPYWAYKKGKQSIESGETDYSV